MKRTVSNTLASTLIAGLISGGTAFAQEAAAPAPEKKADTQVSTEKNKCKGHEAKDKNSCKGHKKHTKKKGEKNSCGKDGCAEKTVTEEAPAAPSAEAK